MGIVASGMCAVCSGVWSLASWRKHVRISRREVVREKRETLFFEGLERDAEFSDRGGREVEKCVRLMCVRTAYLTKSRTHVRLIF